MKAFLLLCGILLLIPLWGNMAFEEQVPLYDFDNPELTYQNTICPNGNMAVMYQRSEMGLRHICLQVFNPQNQALWDEPIHVYGTVPLYCMSMKMIANQDNSISICSLKRNESSGYRYVLDTYDAQGNPVAELSDITVYERYGLSSGTVHFLSDQEGGFHFSIHDGLYFYRYQHIDSAGNLAHPVNGLNLGDSDLDYRFVMIATADNGAVITYSHYDDSYQDRILLTKIDGDHQIAWQSDYQAADMFPYSLLLLDGNDNAFYTVAKSSLNGVAASKIDYLGNYLWPQEWTPESSHDRRLSSAVVTSLGNLVVHTAYVQGYSLPDYYYCDVIDPSGITLHSSEIDHHAAQLLADHCGGWYALNTDNSLFDPSDEVLVQYFDSDYVSGTEPVDFAPNVHLRNYAAFITPEGDLRILYDYTHENQAEICTQLVDNQLNLAYPQSGISLVSGVRDMAFDVMAIAMPNGALFTMWRQGNNSYLYPHKIMYNVVTPRGQTLFSTAQCLMEEAQYIRWFWLSPADDGQVLICWVQGSGDCISSYAQLLKPGTGALWEPEGRLLFSGPGEPNFSYHDGSLYLTRDLNSEIRIHRYVNGLPMWDSNGILAAEPNPDFAGSTLSVRGVHANRLFWSQQYNTIHPEMSFMNIFSEEGVLQFPIQGVALDTLSEDYLGIGIAQIFAQGSDLIAMLRYHYRVWEHDGGPTSPSSWHYYWTPAFSIVQADGSIVSQALFPSYNYEDVNCMTEDAYYCTDRANAPYIKKYDLSGNCMWYVQYAYSSITALLPLSDDRIMIVSRLYDSLFQHQLYYALLSADGSIEYPADALFAEGSCQAAYATDFGAFLLMVPYLNGVDISHGAGVLYYELNTWNNDDSHQSPGLLSLAQNHPNPFRENTALSLKMPDAAPLKLKVYNIRGQCVKTIHNQALAKGDHLLKWDGKDEAGKSCASGVYIFRAETPFGSKTIKALKLK